MGGEAVGTIIARPSGRFISNAEASKYLYCDGNSFSAALYPKLYQVLGTTTLPDLRERFLEGLDTTGLYLEAGLPNITGQTRCAFWNNESDTTGNYINGAIKETYSSTAHWSTGGATVRREVLNFDASRNSSIYKNDCTTVQPSAYTVRYYIRAK